MSKQQKLNRAEVVDMLKTIIKVEATAEGGWEEVHVRQAVTYLKTVTKVLDELELALEQPVPIDACSQVSPLMQPTAERERPDLPEVWRPYWRLFIDRYCPAKLTYAAMVEGCGTILRYRKQLKYWELAYPKCRMNAQQFQKAYPQMLPYTREAQETLLQEAPIPPWFYTLLSESADSSSASEFLKSEAMVYNTEGDPLVGDRVVQWPGSIPSLIWNARSGWRMETARFKLEHVLPDIFASLLNQYPIPLELWNTLLHHAQYHLEVLKFNTEGN